MLCHEFKERYVQVAAASRALARVDRDELWMVGMWQVWLDPMLAASLLLADGNRWRTGLSVLVYPERNHQVRDAGATYAALLRRDVRKTVDGVAQFEMRPLEQLVQIIASAISAPWIAAFHGRHLDFEKLAPLTNGGTQA